MRELARQAEQTDVPGLADVQHRRDRRQRNTVLGTGVAVLAVLGSTALFLNPFGADPSIQPIGPGPSSTVTSVAGGTQTIDPAPPTGAGQSGATGGSTPSGGTGTAAPPDETPLEIDLGSLATAAELSAAGVVVPGAGIGDADGQPTLPPMCTAGSWQEQHSDPVDRVSDAYVVDGGLVVLDLLAYPSGTDANAALVKLKEDARACPLVNEFLSVEVTAVGEAIGDEFVVFALDSESGEDGAIERIWVTVARLDNVLVAATLDRDPGFAGDVSGDESLSRAAATANVEHLQAT